MQRLTEARLDPVDHYARLKETIRGLEVEAAALREIFLRPGARLRSNQFQVLVRHQTRRVFQKDRLPTQILNDPKYWTEVTNPVVTVQPLSAPNAAGRSSDEPVLIEPF